MFADGEKGGVFVKSYMWNPWHGCVKYSEGCANCYVYRRDEAVGRDSARVEKTASFDLPVKHNKYGVYNIPSGAQVFACMTSDFFLDFADGFRADAWKFIRIRRDVDFCIITKRITRFYDCIPEDWGGGYPNVSICATVENQRQCDIRLPVLKEIPARRKFIVSEPLLGKIDMSRYLGDDIEKVVVGGESGFDARVCDYEWVLDIRRQCIEKSVPFYFKQTGARLLKDNQLYKIPRAQQHKQAKKANINTAETFMPRNMRNGD